MSATPAAPPSPLELPVDASRARDDFLSAARAALGGNFARKRTDKERHARRGFAARLRRPAGARP